MKIALISPPLLLTPPRGYGGLEQVVYDLGCALVEQENDVTLFAPPGSHIDGGNLVETVAAPERTDVNWIQLEQDAFTGYKDKLQGFDIIHSHDWFAFPYLAKLDPANKNLKLCHTHHGHLSDWNPKNVPEPIKPVNLIAISKYMQSEYKAQGWEAKYVYNGINLDKYPFSDKKEDYFVFVGRITKIKGVHIALKVAQETNTPIHIIGGTFIDASEKEFLEAIKKECENSHGLATLHLDLAHDKKVELLQHAKACLIPSNFKEPFGLTAVESLATGTPVVCLADGALGEIVGVAYVGSVCRSYDDFLWAAKTIDKVGCIPAKCRERAETFSRGNMAKNYTELYKEIISGKGW